MGHRCPVGMPRQLRLALHTAMNSPTVAQPRRPLSLPGMGPTTLRRTFDWLFLSYGATQSALQPAYQRKTRLAAV